MVKLRSCLFLEVLMYLDLQVFALSTFLNLFASSPKKSDSEKAAFFACQKRLSGEQLLLSGDLVELPSLESLYSFLINFPVVENHHLCVSFCLLFDKEKRHVKNST